MPIQARAVHKYRWMSPRKVRRIINEIRGLQVEPALNMLHFSPHTASKAVEKAVRSAVANLINSEAGVGIDPEKIRISAAFADGGKVYKKIRPRAMGRAGWVRKRTSHITVVVEA